MLGAVSKLPSCGGGSTKKVCWPQSHRAAELVLLSWSHCRHWFSLSPRGPSNIPTPQGAAVCANGGPCPCPVAARRSSSDSPCLCSRSVVVAGWVSQAAPPNRSWDTMRILGSRACSCLRAIRSVVPANYAWCGRHTPTSPKKQAPRASSKQRVSCVLASKGIRVPCVLATSPPKLPAKPS